MFEKKCTQCKRWLPTTGFHGAGYRGGRKVLRGDCKECESIATTKRHIGRPSTYAGMTKQRRARLMIRRNIKIGKLQRGICSICGVKDAQAHHPDYDKPLEIQWLCKPCHFKLHYPFPSNMRRLEDLKTKPHALRELGERT